METSVGDAEDVHARERFLATALHHLQLTHHAVAVHALVQPDESIRYREDRVAAQLSVGIFAQQEGGRLPAGEIHGQALHEALQFHFAGGGLAHQAAE